MAICKLKPCKNNGDLSLVSDYFIHAGPDLSVHIALLCTGIISHGFVPNNLPYSTRISVPKKSGSNATQSNNYRGIALRPSSIFGKIFDRRRRKFICHINGRLPEEAYVHLAGRLDTNNIHRETRLRNKCHIEELQQHKIQY